MNQAVFIFFSWLLLTVQVSRFQRSQPAHEAESARLETQEEVIMKELRAMNEMLGIVTSEIKGLPAEIHDCEYTLMQTKDSLKQLLAFIEVLKEVVAKGHGLIQLNFTVNHPL